jgi:uncharacterized protein (TIGR00251 family)
MVRGRRLWRPISGGVELYVHVTPKSFCDAVEAVETSSDRQVVKVRVHAAPDKGRANAITEEVVAEWLGVPKRTVAVASGEKSRHKSLIIAGETDKLARLIEAGLKTLG